VIRFNFAEDQNSTAMKRSLCIAGLLSASIAASAQWVQQVTNTSANLTSVHFPTASTGYIAGNFSGYGGYLKTTDGGNTWNSSLIAFAPFETIHFSTSDSGTTVGYGVFFRTTDSGSNWNNPATPASYTMDLWSFNNNTILLLGSFGTSYITYDGGMNWTTRTDTVAFESLFFLDQSTGYAAGWDGTFNYRGVISKTTDQGLNWTHHYLSNNTVLGSIHFPSTNVGYALGSDIMVKTSDGGITWAVLTLDSTCSYTDVYFSSETRGHVVGMTEQGYPVILSTDDGGMTWIKHVLGNTSRTLQSVWCTDDNTCFAAGDSGMVFKTTNAGGLGISEIGSSNNISAYPNPFTEHITISVEGDLVIGDLIIYDVYGREMRRITGHKLTEMTISRNGLAAGVYYYVLQDGPKTTGAGKIIAR
jgi:photosystem II stability/assembly factor-like uncharacterized protein